MDRMMDRRRSENFMRQFRNKTNQELTIISSSQLLTIWNHYDKDGNGFIEEDELDDFLKEFVSSVCQEDVGTEVVSSAMLDELKRDFMDAYDENGDGRIEIRELAELLPMDENFLLLFQLDNRLHSSVDFMQIWNTYDKDNSGYIESSELKGFLKDLIEKTKPGQAINEEKLNEYSTTLIEMFDDNKDGKLQLSEMARLLPVKENVVSSTLTKSVLRRCSTNVTKEEIEKIFYCYDKDKSGELEGEEIRGFAKDFMDAMTPSKPITAADVDKFVDLLMKSCDLDGDGKLSRPELTLILLGLQRFSKPK